MLLANAISHKTFVNGALYASATYSNYHIPHAPITLMNSINIALAVEAFIADSCMHRVLYITPWGKCDCMPH